MMTDFLRTLNAGSFAGLILGLGALAGLFGWRAIVRWRGIRVPRRRKIPRNRPCPCGSGRKWKRCCGASP